MGLAGAAGLFFCLEKSGKYFILQIVRKRQRLIREDIMVKNNIELDVKVKCIEEGKTQAQVAKEIDTTRAYVNRVIKRNESVVNNTFVKMLEALGYDIELHYVKREG